MSVQCLHKNIFSKFLWKTPITREKKYLNSQWLPELIWDWSLLWIVQYIFSIGQTWFSQCYKEKYKRFRNSKKVIKIEIKKKILCEHLFFLSQREMSKTTILTAINEALRCQHFRIRFGVFRGVAASQKDLFSCMLNTVEIMHCMMGCGLLSGDIYSNGILYHYVLNIIMQYILSQTWHRVLKMSFYSIRIFSIFCAAIIFVICLHTVCIQHWTDVFGDECVYRAARLFKWHIAFPN